MAECKTGHRFRNWAHTLEFKPRQFCKPKTEDALAAIVQAARARGGAVKTQGAGHSFSQLLPTDDTLVSLDDMDNEWIGVHQREVRVPAGMRLKDLIKAMKREGLALKNMGSITEQSIAGAVSTGTHGTGITLGSISTQVLAAKLVDGRGDVVTLPKGDDRLRAASLGIGALGILTEVTLDCVDMYQLEYTAYVGKFDDVMAVLDQLTAENDRVLLWWLVPLFDRDDVVIITKNRVGTPPGVLGGATNLVRTAFGISGTRPLGKDIDALWTFLAAQGRSSGKFRKLLHFRADYDEVLTLPLLPIFHTECEYAVPAANAVAALERLRAIVEENDFDLKLPVEVRFSAQDDRLLSPSWDGPSCWIGASTEHNTAEVFARFEPLMVRFGGRPHWGKHFTLTREQLAGMYGPRLDEFVGHRDAFDPDRVFANTFLTDVLG
jgi:FAD/FMN-containing dehydrogenase